MSQFPHAKVSYNITNPGDFEVTVNGTLLYSKKKTGSFPNMDILMKKIGAIEKGEDPDSIVDKSSSGCVLF